MTFRDRALAIALAFLAATGACAQSPRISQAIAESGPRVALHGTVSAKALAAKDLGELPSATPVHSVSLRFSLAAAQNAELSQLLDDQQNPASAHYHQWLTPEQYATRFGLAEQDVARITTYLTTQGLTVKTISRSRSFLTVSATAGQLKSALGVALHAVTLDGETHIANLTEPKLPEALAAVTQGIAGLNDFRLKPRIRVSQVAAPNYSSANSSTHYLAPGDLYTIYDLNPLLASSMNGSGVTIAVLGQTDIPLTSAAAFRSASGLAANPPVIKLYGSDPGTSPGDLAEALLDVEWSGAIAPAATILYVNSTDVIAGSLTAAVDDNVAPILSISYGDCEQDFGSANIALYNQVLRQANAQGQTVVGPAGDAGATDCDYNVAVATHGLAVDYPASSPNVTAVGGTMFNEGSGNYFNPTNGAYSGSAMTYIPEVAWNETAGFGSLTAGGGGASAYFTKPGYQVGVGVPNDYSRDVPDLSLASAALHDGYLLCLPGYCTNGYRSASGSLTSVGGTSVAVPEFAGLLALLEQKIQGRVGNANPKIYGLAGSSYAAAVFHDITAGSNAEPCQAGSTGCPTGGTLGYTARTGYDLATGWGSVDGFNFVTDWPLAAPTGTGGATGMTRSSVLLLDSAATVMSGGTITFSAVVASDNAATTTTPTGTLQFLVDNVPTGSAFTLGSGSVSYPLETAGLTLGSHVVTAAYSGDSVFLGSKSSVQIGVLPATIPDFAITPGSANVAAQSGSNAAPITFTVTSLNGFSGPVVFSATTTSSTFQTTGAYSFLPPQITLSSGGTGTTVLTLSAFRAQSFVLAQKIPAGLAFTGLFSLCLFVPQKRLRAGVAATLLSLSLVAATGCSSPTATPAASAAPINTPAGTYTVLVTATGTSSTGATPAITPPSPSSCSSAFAPLFSWVIHIVTLSSEQPMPSSTLKKTPAKRPVAGKVAARQIAAASPAPVAPVVPKDGLFFSRDESWLAFDERVLEEAEDERNPLLERVKFLAITASNLDEFVEIRVAGVLQRIEDGLGQQVEPDEGGLLPQERLDRISRSMDALVKAQYKCWNDDLLPALKVHGVRVLRYRELTKTARAYADKFYSDEIDPLLTPVTIDPSHPFPRVLNKALCLALLLRYKRKGGKASQSVLGVVTIPRTLPRLISLPAAAGKTHYIFLHELVEAKVEQMFRGYQVLSKGAFRVTRNSNLYMQEEESRSVLESVREELHNRRKGDAVRLEIEDSAGDEIVERLRVNFELDRWQVFRTDGPVNLYRLMNLYSDTPLPALKYPSFTGTPYKLSPGAEDLFAELREHDVLLHHPFESYSTVQDFISSGAHDDSVVSMKQTLYRTSKDSPIFRALIQAAESKDVTVVVELMARFDEDSNIRWARELEDAGVGVFHGIVGRKTHCKLSLLVRRDPDGQVRRYAHLGTGNYNPVTSRFYTDISLLTARPEITHAVQAVFNYLTSNAEEPYRPLLVAPISLAEDVLGLIRREDGACAGGSAGCHRRENECNP